MNTTENKLTHFDAEGNAVMVDVSGKPVTSREATAHGIITMNEDAFAAVQNGADAVYMGMGDFNARRGAKNFTDEEFVKAVRYCHVRGCKVYVTLNTLVNDREMHD